MKYLLNIVTLPNTTTDSDIIITYYLIYLTFFNLPRPATAATATA